MHSRMTTHVTLPHFNIVTRRTMLRSLAAAGAMLHVTGVLAETLGLTPAQTEGPFYPDKLPLDTDNDLIVLNNSLDPSVGTITHLTGRVLTDSGSPVRNAVVEIWQADANGAYLHSGTMNKDKQDKNFQGFGRFLTDSQGRYYFRTIKPVEYPGRTPHIHVAVNRGGKRALVTQLYVAGHAGNERDGILRNTANRDRLIVPFTPVEGSASGELAANFEIVLGATPADA